MLRDTHEIENAWGNVTIQKNLTPLKALLKRNVLFSKSGRILICSDEYSFKIRTLFSKTSLDFFFFFGGGKSEFLFHFEKLYFQNGLKRSYSEIYCIFGLDSENAEFLFLTVISIEF